MAIKVDDLVRWYKAQELVYASQGVRGDDKYHVRLTVSRFSDFPTCTVTRRNILTLKTKELYHGTSVDAAVRIYNDAIGE